MEINGRLGNLTHTVSKTPESMVTKTGMGDEVGDPYPYAKFHYDRIRGFCSLPQPCFRVRRSVQSDSASFFVLPTAETPAPGFPNKLSRCTETNALTTSSKRLTPRLAEGDCGRLGGALPG